jgi:hypothetical protein
MTDKEFNEEFPEGLKDPKCRPHYKAITELNGKMDLVIEMLSVISFLRDLARFHFFMKKYKLYWIISILIIILTIWK